MPVSDTLTATAPEPPAAQLLDVRAVAALLGCSARHVYRLADAGQMPAPVRLGTLVRWPRQAIEEWIAGGCRPGRQARRGEDVPPSTPPAPGRSAPPPTSPPPPPAP